MGRAPGPVGCLSTEIAMNETPEKDEGIVLTEAQQRARRSRSIAIALALGGLVILFFVMSIVRLHATFQ